MGGCVPPFSHAQEASTWEATVASSRIRMNDFR